MQTASILIALCLGVATASVVKRQATPPVPTLPPMKSGTPSAAPIMSSTNAPGTPPPPSSQPQSSSAPTQQPSSSSMPVVSDSTQEMITDTPAMPVMVSSTPMVASSTPMTVNSSTMKPSPIMSSTMSPTPTMAIDTTTTMAPTTTTTGKPKIEELVSVDEILEVFGNVATSPFFKKLPEDDQLLVMEILAGGETGKMTAILSRVEVKHLLTFMYNLPFKYVDSLWRIIDLGYTREEILSQ